MAKEILSKIKTNPIQTAIQTKINRTTPPRPSQLSRTMEIKPQLTVGIILKLWLESDLLFPVNSTLVVSFPQ
jgi:hypothetical protein